MEVGEGPGSKQGGLGGPLVRVTLSKGFKEVTGVALWG